MKKFHFLILISVVLCAVLAFALVGCNKNALPRPSGLQIDGPTLTLSWRANDSAAYYVVNISGNGRKEDKNTRKNSLSLANLGLETGDYQLKVKACSSSKDFKDSPWSNSISYSQDADTGLSFVFTNNGKEVEVAGLGCAEGDIVIPDTYRGMPITSIGAQAFRGKSKLTGVVMSNNIKSIGKGAFYNCTFLKSVTFSQNLTSIGDNAFQSCRWLEGVLTIPQNVTAIGENAFIYCDALTDVQFNSGLKEIGKNAFASCKGLTALSIPNSIETIGNSAFYDCQQLKSVQLGSGVKLIDESAFAKCISLESVTFNAGLKTVGKFAFRECTELKTVICSDSIEKICEKAFYDDAKLSSVTLGNGLKRIESDAFLNTAIWKNSPQNEVYLCKWFLGCKDNTVSDITFAPDTIGIANAALFGYENLIGRITLPNTVKIIGDTAFATSKISSVIIGGGVEEIGKQAFSNCAMLSIVKLGEYDNFKEEIVSSSLREIGEYAFYACAQLENIEIPQCVEVIKTYAFNESALYKNSSKGVVYAGNWAVGCDSSRTSGKITIAAGTVGIANYAFYNCTNITGVEIPDSVKIIGRSAFYQCTKLASAVLPSSLEVIEDYTFYGCTALVLPELPQTLKTIGRSAFYKCALRNADGKDTENDVLIIPDSVERIGDFAFYGCGYTYTDVTFETFNCGIDSIVLGSGVKHIGENAFNNIVTLKKVVFGSNVKTVGVKAFYKCESLSEVQFNSGLQQIGVRAFYGCGKLERIVLPDSLTEIGDYAFYKCIGLADVTFGRGLRRIGNFAFYGCESLVRLNLSGISSIGRQAFRACTSLMSVILDGGVNEIEDHAFYGCSSLTIYSQTSAAKDSWSLRFNSGYRPVVWGCTFKDGYVYSVTKGANTVSNLHDGNELSAPQRDGYSFVGWSTAEGAASTEYTAEGLAVVNNGTKVYAVWIKE